MVWRKKYNWRYYTKGKQDPINSQRFRKTKSFKVDRENLMIVERMATARQLTPFINQAISASQTLHDPKFIEFKRMFESDPKRFLELLIPEYPSYAKHLIRKVGKQLANKERDTLKIDNGKNNPSS